jgi:hypothetical protein
MTDDDAKLHTKALKQFETIQDSERESRELAVEDMRFVNVEGAQWEDDFDKREDKPRLTVNRVAGLVDQLMGEQRQGRASIKYLAMSADASEESAKIKSGLVRNIENESDAHSIYDSSFDEMVTGGFGGWRILTEFEDDSFDQVIKLEPLDAIKYDKRDAKYAFLVTDVHPNSFERDYPDATTTSFPRDKYTESFNREWFGEEKIKIAEYWYKCKCKKNIALLSDGRVIDVDEEADVLDEIKGLGIEVLKERTVETHKVFMRKMNGAEWLSEPEEFPSKFIPLVPEYGKITHVEGKTYIRGLTRFSKDPQRIYNYATSAVVEATANAPKDPIWITAAQAKGYESDLESFNTKNSPFMLYNSDPEAGGVPQRGGAPQVQQALMAQIQQGEMDIYATSNIYPPSLGMNPGLQSGKALIHQDEKGDRGSFVFSDNHLKSIRYGGEIIDDIIPKVYDRERVVKVMNLDGSVELETINKFETDVLGVKIKDQQTGKEVVVNDLTAGKYGTIVDTAPMYKTQKEESFNQLVELAKASPIFAEFATDLIAKNLSALESDELHKRIRKKMVMAGTIDPTDEEVQEFGLDQPQQPDPQQVALTDNINMQTEQLKSEITLNDAKEAETIANTQSKTMDTYKKLVEAYEKQLEAGIPLTPADLALKTQAQAMIELANEQVKA